jgi:hypothetical protein
MAGGSVRIGGARGKEGTSGIFERVFYGGGSDRSDKNV